MCNSDHPSGMKVLVSSCQSLWGLAQQKRIASPNITPPSWTIQTQWWSGIKRHCPISHFWDPYEVGSVSQWTLPVILVSFWLWASLPSFCQMWFLVAILSKPPGIHSISASVAQETQTVVTPPLPKHNVSLFLILKFINSDPLLWTGKTDYLLEKNELPKSQEFTHLWTAQINGVPLNGKYKPHSSRSKERGSYYWDFGNSVPYPDNIYNFQLEPPNNILWSLKRVLWRLWSSLYFNIQTSQGQWSLHFHKDWGEEETMNENCLFPCLPLCFLYMPDKIL